MHRLFIALTIAASLVFAGRAALAQDTAAAREATALALRNRCIELSRAQSYAEAVEACTRSLSLIESPNTRLDLGRAYLALGRLASALRELERSRDTARGRIDAGHQQYIRTQQAAAAEADALRARVPTVAFQFSRTPPEQTEVAFGSVRLPARDLIAPVPIDPGSVTIRVAGPAIRTLNVSRTIAEGEHVTVPIEVLPVGHVRIVVRPPIAGLRVSIDGRALASDVVGAANEVTVGSHTIEVRAPGHPSLRERRDVAAGQEAVFYVATDPAGGPRFVEGPQGPAGSSGPGTPSTSAAFPAGIAFAVLGAAALGTGVGLWAAADGEYRTLLDLCMGNPCTDPMLINRATTGQTLETVGGALMIGGGVVFLVGTVMAIAGRPRGAERPPAVRPAFGPRTAGVSVSF